MAKKTKRYVWKNPSMLAGTLVAILVLNTMFLAWAAAMPLYFGATADYSATQENLSDPQLLHLLTDFFRGVMLLLTGLTLVWTWRVSTNAHSFRPNMEMSRLGSIGWYVVPIFFLFKPYQAMAEIWRVSETEAKKGAHRIVNWWWGAFLLSNILGYMVLSPAGARLKPWLGISSDVCGVFVSLFLMVMVTRLSRMQVAKHAQRQAGGGESIEPSLSMVQSLAG